MVATGLVYSIQDQGVSAVLRALEEIGILHYDPIKLIWTSKEKVLTEDDLNHRIKMQLGRY